MTTTQVLSEVSRGRYETSFDDPLRFENADGSRSARFLLGDDEHGPMVTLYDAPSTYRFAPHSHRCPYMSIIVRGSLRVGKKWYGVGDIRLQEAGSVYGPEQAGPDGCLMINIFADRQGGVPSLAPDGRPAVSPEDFQAFLSHVSVILGARPDAERSV